MAEGHVAAGVDSAFGTVAHGVVGCEVVADVDRFVVAAHAADEEQDATADGLAVAGSEFVGSVYVEHDVEPAAAAEPDVAAVERVGLESLNRNEVSIQG